MSDQETQTQIAKLLRSNGVIAAGDLVKELGVSRATLARYLKDISSQLVVIGKTRNLQYALKRPVTDLDDELPLFRIDEQGKINPAGKLIIVHGGYSVVEPGGQVFEAMPPEISDMAPQGFMGRAFASRFASELGLSPRLQDWSDDHILRAVAKRGEDCSGNLIVGKDSVERWQKLSYANAKKINLTKLVEQAFSDQPAGSSAGGEQPKFTVVLDGVHKLVKFAGPLNNPVQKRWRDLLYCEAIAGDVLFHGGVPAARSKISESGNHVFLVVERFDRVGLKGRKPFLSLAAADGFHSGERDSWTAAALRLRRGGFVSESDTKKIQLIDAFAQLIGDSDRHFYNIGLFPKFTSLSSLAPEHYELAPVFDKLPMLFAPSDGRIIERQFSMPIPGADLIEVWPEALSLARMFWDKVAKEKSISTGFRRIAKGCLKALVA